MKWSKWLENWDMTGLRISAGFLNMEWKPNDADKDAAWDMYIELLTRITTQKIPEAHGDEKTALDSVYKLFPLTREIIRTHGRDCIEFTKIAVVVLNQVIRPFTADWHKKSLAGAFEDKEQREKFRGDLEKLQRQLRNYTKMLADMAGVEDLTSLQE